MLPKTAKDTKDSQSRLDFFLMYSAKYVCRYLAGTKDYSIIYDGKTAKGIAAYTDSDWASDPIMRQSVTGYFFKLARGPITWQS